MAAPLVSVVIPTYNGERFLREAVDSALAQTHKPLEIIVVDDGSTDGTLAILAGYGSRIRVFRQENTGQSAARNVGISKAAGEWIGFLDQDDLWDPRKIEKQLAAATEGVDAILSDLRMIDDNGVTTRERCYNLPRNARLALGDIITNPGWSQMMVVRRRALEAVGGFDRTNRFGTEDYQLRLRLAATGHNFRYVDEVLASYRWHGTNMSSDRNTISRGAIHSLTDTFRRYRTAFARRDVVALHKALSTYHFHLAWHEYNRKSYQAAAQNFWCSVRHNPRSGRLWLYALATSLPFRNQVLPRLRAFVTGRGVRPAS